MGVLLVSLHQRLIAERDFPGLWPHKPGGRLQASEVLRAAGFTEEDLPPQSPTVRVRVTAAYWHDARELDEWLAARLEPAVDGAETWVDRRVLVALREHATEQVNAGRTEEWGTVLVQVAALLDNLRLRGCDYWYTVSR
jgi:hypothetical protein